ncbi:tripartite tricarboxylate transporter substrate binding protein [Virgibacillus ainsalahensis]
MSKRILGLFVLIFGFVFISACGSSETSGNSEKNNEEVDNYPNRPIEIIAGGGAGGGTDTISRAVARELSEILETEVNVVNSPGAAGAVASQELNNRPADGYTIMPTTSDFQINIAAEKTDNYFEEFDTLARIHEDTYAIWAQEGGEYSNLESLIEAAKENPGEIVIGGTGSGGLDEITVSRIEEAADIDLNYTAYEDAGRFQTDLIGGHIDLIIDEIGPVAGLYEGGEITPLTILAAERLEDFPDTPTTVEKGIDVTNGMSRGFMIKNDVPEEIKTILAEAIEEAVSSESYQETAEQQYLHLKDGWLNSKEYSDLLETEIEEFSSQLN